MLSRILSRSLIALTGISLTGFAQSAPQDVVANVSVVDVYAQPITDESSAAGVDLLTQALYAEPMSRHGQEGEWYHVSLPQQPFYQENDFAPLQGWVRAQDALQLDEMADDTIVVTEPKARIFTGMSSANDSSSFLLTVSMGTRLVGLEETLGFWRVRLNNGVEGYMMGANVSTLSSFQHMSVKDLRDSIAHVAKKLLDTPYLVGGRSADGTADGGRGSGLDDAGFIHLVYHTHGITIPRFKQDMYLVCTNLRAYPQKGDLIFFKDDAADRIVHVMMVLDHDTLIEATGLTHSVRKISVQERLGRPLDQWVTGDRSGDYTVLFGTYLNNPS